MLSNKNKLYVGSCCGNKFVILDCRENDLSKEDKSSFAKTKILEHNVDSALFIKKSEKYDVFMEIFEKDGSESDSCGNGMILVSYLLGLNKGVIEMNNNAITFVEGDSDKQSLSIMTDSAQISEIKNHKNCLYVKIIEPHIVYTVENLDSFNLINVGDELQKDYKGGVNVDAIQKVDEFSYLIKTYERGVFDKTESCGTGSLSAYVTISYFNDRIYDKPVKFKSEGGDHFISRDKNILKLETFKKFCKIEALE